MAGESSVNILPLSLKAHLLAVTDSLAQPGLSLFQALVLRHSLSSTRSAALLCLQNDPVALCSPLQQSGSSKALHIFDSFNPSSHSGRFEASLQPAATATTSYRHLRSPESVIEQLDDAVDTLFIDSLSDLASRSSTREALLFLRTCYARFPQIHIVCLVSADLDTEPSPLISAITTLPLSRTFAKLSIHPSHLLHALKLVYNLNPDSPALHSFLARFQQRGWAGHGYRSEEADELEQRSASDALGGRSGGRAVLQWELRGHELLRLLGSTTTIGNERAAPVKSGEGATKAESIKRGLATLVPDEVGLLDTAPLEQITSDFVSISKAAGLQVQDPTVESISATLPFNLSLTSAQRAEKESTILPFHREAGEAGAEAIIHYEADSADDIDEEEGDED